MDANSALVLAGLAILLAPVVCILWKNVKLSRIWKAIFILSVLPVFIVAMMINFWIVGTYAPWLFDAYREARENEFGRLHRSAGAIILFVLAIPVPLVVSSAWYFLIRAAD